MTLPRYARFAARLLSREPEEVPPPSPDHRARAIDGIAGALRAKRSRRRARAAVLAAAAMAAGVAAIGVGLHGRHAPPAVANVDGPRAPVRVIAHPSGEGAIVAGGANALLVEGEAVAPGSRIIARGSGHAILAFSTGTRLTVEDGGDITLVDGGPTSVVALGRGAVRADVAKLGPRERFLVRTDDAEIEVRGTSFRVLATPDAACAGSTTRVEVYEGVVVVRHGGDEARVARGESWPAGCAERATPASPPSAPPTARQPSGAPARTAAAASSLAAQNDLFSAAVAAKQHGDAGSAIDRFDDFLARYPSSPLAESAAAQRMKLLHAIDSDRAEAAARAYLARWPEGFARAEAEGIVAGAR